ncbi:helix-turn-helix domain-containing protein, partial [Escherichia coli]|nr:helix-turn-helix domain-containing protein [Escherichia coli]MDW6469303.1 helix-turn-helix domain-containing protein [Escherichia coli]
MQNLDEPIKGVGIPEVAKACGVSERAVYKWLKNGFLNRPGFPGEYFICELRLPDHRFRWKHNKLFLLLPE